MQRTLNTRFIKIFSVAAAFSLMLFVASQASAQTWNTVWSQTFNGPAGSYPSTNDWNYNNGNPGVNGEWENYCPPWSNTAPCSTSNQNIYEDGNGNLVIRAINNGGTWTSGRMDTSGHHDIQYGRFEAKMILPSGAGLWPAWWMLGSNIGSVGWPACGEIDIMENIPAMGQYTIQSSTHGANGFNTGNQTGLSNGDFNWHVYGVNWWPGNVDFYVDNYQTPFVSITPSSSGGTWEFDNGPFFMLLNLAVGGGWPGSPNSSTPNPAYMLINSINVLQYSSSGGGDGGPVAGAWYNIINQNSGSCVDDAAWGTANGNHVQQWSCGSQQYNQEWQFVPTSNGYYSVLNRNAAAENEVWDVTGGAGATSPGTPIQTWSNGQGTNQQWMPISLGNGYYKFVVRNSGMCLDVPGDQTTNGLQLDAWTCNGTAAQAFKLSQQP